MPPRSRPSPGRRRPSRARATPLPLLTRAEILAWSLLARVLVGFSSLEWSLRLLDRLPSRGPVAEPVVSMPPASAFRGSGACLGRSLARSQFLRVRGQPHAIVIGVRGGTAAFQAHAWVEPYDQLEPDFVEIRRIPR